MTSKKSLKEMTAEVKAISREYCNTLKTAGERLMALMEGHKKIATGIATFSAVIIVGAIVVNAHAPFSNGEMPIEEPATVISSNVQEESKESSPEEVAVTTTAITTSAPEVEVAEETTAITTSTPEVEVVPEETTTTTTAEIIPIEPEVIIPEYNWVENEDDTTTQETYDSYEEIYTDIWELPISQADVYLLCNLVGREYGSDWIAVDEKAKVAAVVMNRVFNDSEHPEFDGINSVRDAKDQPGQFEGWLPDYEFTSQVTQSVKDAVVYYFNHASDSEYTWEYYYYGDGGQNYFRTYY